MALLNPSRQRQIHQTLFTSGKKIHTNTLSVYVGNTKELSAPLFCVAKKSYRTKPTRNRLKRLAKEAFRLSAQEGAVPENDMVIMALSAKAGLKEYKGDLQKAFSKIATMGI